MKPIFVPMKRCNLSILCLCFLLAANLLSACGEKEVQLRIVATSDVHGNFFPYDFINDRPASGSLARVEAYLTEQRQQWGDRLIYVENGDILQGQPSAYYYNTVAATAACCSLAGMETETVLKLAEGFDIGVTKRYEEREILGRPAKFILTKQNPASVDQSVLFIAQKPGPRTAIIIAGNMFHTENKDVLYMYDVAYENLAGVEYLIIVGERRYDMAVRLKLAGVDMKKVQICETEDDLPACLEKTKGDIYVMSPLHAQTSSKLLRS